MRRGICLLVLVGLCVCVGCGRDAATIKGLVKVTGTVTYQSKPVDGATVTFSPVSGGRAAGGRTDAGGKFQLTTLNAGDGAPPGKYKVAVSKTENLGPESQMTAEDMAKMVAGGKGPPAGPTPRGQYPAT